MSRTDRFYETDGWGRTESDKIRDQAYRHMCRLDNYAYRLLETISRQEEVSDADLAACEAANDASQAAYEAWVAAERTARRSHGFVA